MITGVHTPIVTPFSGDESIDFEAMKHNLGRWKRTDLDGVLVLGSNGEFPYLLREEKTRLVGFVRKHWPLGRSLLAGTGCQTTEETSALTAEAAAEGADAVLVLPPHYYRGLMTEEALYAHYAAVADSSPVPVLIYNMPANTGINLSSSLVSRLAAHGNIVGIKDSSGNIVQIAEIVRGAIERGGGEGFAVLAGSASFLLPSLSVGAKGAVAALGNILPDECCRLYSLALDERWNEARELQLRLLEINATVTSGLGVPALKAAMDLLGYRGGCVRRPLQPLAAGQIEHVRDVLRRCRPG